MPWRTASTVAWSWASNGGAGKLGIATAADVMPCTAIQSTQAIISGSSHSGRNRPSSMPCCTTGSTTPNRPVSSTRSCAYCSGRWSSRRMNMIR